MALRCRGLSLLCPLVAHCQIRGGSHREWILEGGADHGGGVGVDERRARAPAGMELHVETQMAARNGAGHQRTGGSTVGEEVTRVKGLVARLGRHVLLT